MTDQQYDEQPVTLEEARAAVVRRHPSVAPVADLLVGESLEAIEAIAVEVESRLAKVEDHAPSTPEREPGDSIFMGPIEVAHRADPKAVARKDAHGMPTTLTERFQAFLKSARAGEGDD